MSSNGAVIAAIRSHHRQLSDELNARTGAVLAAVRPGGPGGPGSSRSSHAPDGPGDARDGLYDWYRAELVPHALAEEKTLYEAAAQLDSTRLLVRGMVTEHEDLVELITELAAARTALDVATLAASAQTLFESHLAKENDLLLPALDEAGADLGALLDGMHEILGEQHSAESEGASHGCGCGGCGCGSDEAQAGAVGVAISPAAAGGDLDVRVLPHGQRHEIIFGRLAELGAGRSLVIVNDHDPKPLRYQTEAMWPDRFTWTYREAGPELWRVEITHVG